MSVLLFINIAELLNLSNLHIKLESSQDIFESYLENFTTVKLHHKRTTSE